MSNRKTFALLTVSALALAACSSTPMNPTASAPAGAAKSTTSATSMAPVAAAPAATPTSSVKTVSLPDYLDPHNSLSTARSVYFEFDGTVLKPEFNALIEKHGKYLAAHPALAIKVEGNTDDRGSAEYNLALGQKRAQNVVQALKVFGVRDAQVEPVSWGEEKPKATGEDESAWAQNRRADLRYPAK